MTFVLRFFGACFALFAVPLSAADLTVAAFDGKRWGSYEVTLSDPPIAEKVLDIETRGPVKVGETKVYSDPSGRIWVQRGGDAPEELPNLPRPCDQPTLSPDQSTVVFACFKFSNRRDDGAIYRVALSDMKLEMIYDGPGLQKSPVFSPDGSQVAFVSGFRISADRVIEHIWIMGADGSDPKAVDDRSDVNIDPAWVDETTLVYSSDQEGLGAVNVWSRSVMGGPTEQLTTGEADLASSVSPDGRIAFIGIVDGREMLVVREANGTQRPIELGMEAVRDPSWVLE